MIVEDGSNVLNANSYLSVEYADEYFALYGQLDWTGEITDKEQALIIATRAIDLLYRDQFMSYKLVDSKNELAFPRYAFYDNLYIYHSNKDIPKSLKDATAEIALMVLSGIDVFPKPSTEAYVKSSTVEIDVLKFVSEYRTTPPAERYSGFNKVELILKPITKAKKTTLTLHR